MTARGASLGRGSHGMILHEIMWRTSGRADPCGGPLVVEQSFWHCQRYKAQWGKGFIKINQLEGSC